jgi:excisionase family DNA binding protein
MTTDLPAFLLPEEVATTLRCSRRSVLRYVQRGLLPAVRIAGTIRVRRADLLALLAKSETDTRDKVNS